MLRIELETQLLRVRSLVLFGVLVALPILAAATGAGGGHGPATFSALNFAESGLNFMDPVLFGLIVAVFGSIIGGADREWGTLRYLYVRPVSRRRLMTGKGGALVVCSALVVVAFLVAALASGVASFGWHAYHRTGAGDLSAASATWAVLGAGGYVAICLLSLGSIALALGLLMPRSVEALGVSVGFLIGSVILDSVRSLHGIAVILPVHYWMRWTQLFQGRSGSGSGLALGLAVQLATTAVALGGAYAILSRRDPAA